MEAADCVLMSLNEDVMWIATRVQRHPQLCDQQFVHFIQENVQNGILGIHESSIFCGSDAMKYNIPKSYIKESFWET